MGGIWRDLVCYLSSRQTALSNCCVLSPLCRSVMSLLNRNGSWLAQTIALSVMVVGALHSLVDFSLEVQANTFVFLSLVAVGLGSTTFKPAPVAAA